MILVNKAFLYHDSSPGSFFVRLFCSFFHIAEQTDSYAGYPLKNKTVFQLEHILPRRLFWGNFCLSRIYHVCSLWLEKTFLLSYCITLLHSLPVRALQGDGGGGDVRRNLPFPPRPESPHQGDCKQARSSIKGVLNRPFASSPGPLY